ncbi:MAG: M20/M25/M40 family metallo-hydrolase [Spirochaetes bacterium]|nr:M20/M25/M40 family metallo-hydrolase [Spirochaetota bacterium]
MQININRDRLIDYFIDLVRIPSPSWKEEKVIEYIINVISKYKDDVEYYKYKCGDSFNLLIRLKGNLQTMPLLFSGHMDTVIPCENVKPVISDTKITSDGTTILGADDKAAIAVFLEVIACLKENNAVHGTVEFLLTCAEETGLHGVKGFDVSLLQSKAGFVFDSNGGIGRVMIKAPFQITYDIQIKGKAAHAGIAPEKGISAIRIASEIISSIPHGRIDEETTANVGMISGGKATNIVAEDTSIALEVRSMDRQKLKAVEKEMENTARTVTKKYKGKISINKRLEYSGYSIKPDDKLIRLLSDSMKKIKIKPVYEASGGGSDTNVLNKAGIKAVNLSIGMRDVHTRKENIMIKDLIDGARLVYAIIRTV